MTTKRIVFVVLTMLELSLHAFLENITSERTEISFLLPLKTNSIPRALDQAADIIPAIEETQSWNTDSQEGNRDSSSSG